MLQALFLKIIYFSQGAGHGVCYHDQQCRIINLVLHDNGSQGQSGASEILW